MIVRLSAGDDAELAPEAIEDLCLLVIPKLILVPVMYVTIIKRALEHTHDSATRHIVALFNAESSHKVD